MNTELQTKLENSASALIDFIEKSGGAAMDFTKEQVPLVIDEILRWGWWSAFVPLVAIPTGAIVSALMARRAYNEIPVHQEGYYRGGKSWESVPGVFCIVCLIATIILSVASVPSTFINGGTVLKISVAPRLYLLDQLKELVK